jgi:hypothetical protein
MNTNPRFSIGHDGRPGTALIPVGSNDDKARSFTLQSDGKIVVAGSSRNIDGMLDFSLIRLNANGSLDTTFNSGVNSLGGLWHTPRAVAPLRWTHLWPCWMLNSPP